MKRYYCNNPRMENFLAEHGLEPKFYKGETAVYNYTKKLQDVLDKYTIKYYICKSNF